MRHNPKSADSKAWFATEAPSANAAGPPRFHHLPPACLALAGATCHSHSSSLNRIVVHRVTPITTMAKPSHCVFGNSRRVALTDTTAETYRRPISSTDPTIPNDIMGKTQLNAEREHRIDMEVVVDAYTAEERALSWYYYQNSSRFPARPTFARQWPLCPCPRANPSRSSDSLMKTCVGLGSSSGFDGANATRWSLWLRSFR
ncbi:unnamed protein product [Candidatus Paraburkholderia kirkii UZHbot1]|uniref:WGS project CAFE00000000 data, contig bkir_c142 n=1 Tax=Candidatus Paraburkholderia kirkii UZHbot1 TaxID=1055526 RepID=U3UAL5_9BURK|nr:unnamed protein product [Candidatus Paraburkholderia kirkii UZHbot1]